MGLIVGFANRLAFSFYKKSQKKFQNAAVNLRCVQESVLMNYIRQNTDTVWGKQHDFSSIRCYRDFSLRLAVHDYEYFRPFVARIMDGEKSVLTKSPVRLLEPTSGTTGGNKLIPYTAELQNEYMAAVMPWLADLYTQRPRLLDGCAYWSVSPVNDDPIDRCSRVPVGFEDDAGYFGALSVLVRKVFPVPPQIKKIRSMENFRFMTGLLLALASDLRLFSVWNPSFLTILLESLHANRDSLVRSIHDGVVYWPKRDDSVPRIPFAAGKDKARKIENAFKDKNWTARLWPRLALVSCWTQGQSSLNIPALKKMLPGIEIQGKGLLATEGIVSFPLYAAGGNVLAARSHFFEFECDDGRIIPAWELEPSMEVKVILTTGGGLYRYALGDRVRVRSFYGNLPVFDFLGRDRVGDLAGEKLSEDSVAQLLAENEDLRNAKFLLVAPVQTAKSLGYVLLAEGLDSMTGRRAASVLEKKFLLNYHYSYARSLGQLSPLFFADAGEGASRRYLEFLSGKGTKAGAVKPSCLYAGMDIRRCFSAIGEI